MSLSQELTPSWGSTIEPHPKPLLALSFLSDLVVFILCICVFCLHVCLHALCMSAYHVYVWYPERPEEGIASPRMQLQTVEVTTWKLKLDILPAQPLLLTTDPPLQAPDAFVLLCMGLGNPSNVLLQAPSTFCYCCFEMGFLSGLELAK